MADGLCVCSTIIGDDEPGLESRRVATRSAAATVAAALPLRSGASAAGTAPGPLALGSGRGGRGCEAQRDRKCPRTESVSMPLGSFTVYSSASWLGLCHTTDASTQMLRSEFHHHTFSLIASSRSPSSPVGTAVCCDTTALACVPDGPRRRGCKPLNGEPGRGEPGIGEPGANTPRWAALPLRGLMLSTVCARRTLMLLMG